jgi:hypothetical protein
MKASQDAKTTLSLPRRMGLRWVWRRGGGAGRSGAGRRAHGPLHIKHHRVRPGRMALPPTNVTTIGVNSYLARQPRRVSFMPLVQTDSNGGVIVTDWY